MPRKAVGTEPEWSTKQNAWVVRARIEGERVRIPIVGAKTADEARKLAPEWIARMRRDGIAPPASVTVSSGPTVRGWSERWCEERILRGLTTVPNDRGYLRNHIWPVIGDRAMSAVTRAELEALVETLDGKARAGEMSEKTAQNVWGTVSKMFADATRSKAKALRVRDDDPTVNVSPPDRGARKAKVFLWPSEVTRLLSCLDVDVEFRRLVAVAVYTYVRASELAALALEDLDLEHGAAHVHRTLARDGSEKHLKGGEARRIPIEANVVPLVRALRDGRSAGRLFPAMPRIDKLSVRLREALRTAGVSRAELFANDDTRKNLTWHDLRATGITWMAVRGDDPLKIQRRAGHKSLTTTQDYIREAESLAEGFGEPFPPLPHGVVRTTIGPTSRKAEQFRCGQQDLKASVTLRTVGIPWGFVTRTDASRRIPTPKRAIAWTRPRYFFAVASRRCGRGTTGHSRWTSSRMGEGGGDDRVSNALPTLDATRCRGHTGVMAPRASSARKSPARRREHPLDRTLREAPVGPPESARERRLVAVAKREIAAGKVLSHAEVKKRLGL